MSEFPKPRLFISRCIELEHCRWNGLRVSSDVVKLIKPYVDVVTTCPEVEIGLGVPRDPIHLEMIDRRVRLIQPATGKDLTEVMDDFAASYAVELGDVDGAILKNRSPSCGLSGIKIHAPGSKESISTKGIGRFAAILSEHYPRIPFEDEGRLTNYTIREHFLTQVFARARWREVHQIGTMGALVDFQARNKMLLLAHSEIEMRQLGSIVANHDHLNVAEAYAAYEEHFYNALAQVPRPTATVNVLMHALGYFDLNATEKGYFLECLDDYRSGQLPLSVPQAIIHIWSIRFQVDYLLQQTFFAPYPEDLVQITDSGKGRSF